MSIARLILASSLLLALAACAVPPRDYIDPRPLPTPEQRAEFGTISITAAGVTAPQEPHVPDSMSNAEKAGISVGLGAVGAGYGAAAGLSCGPFAPACVLVFAAVFGGGGLLGGMIGTITYRTVEQVSSADITLRNALLSVDVEQRLVKIVMARALIAANQNPRQMGYSDDAGTWNIGDTGEVGTRILIAIPKLSLVALDPDQNRNPDVRLEITGEARIFRNNEQEPAFERRWLYDSGVHGYFDWAEDQGVLVITEIDLAVAALGARMAADLLGPESEAVAEPDPPEDVVASSASESADSEAGEEGGGDGGLLSTASSFFKSIFSSEPAEE